MVQSILIADDDIEIAELIYDSLIDEGFQAKIVNDGKMAFDEIMKNQSYDLVILDIMMPNMDGLELCKKIRHLVSCPIIFVSAKNRTLDTMIGLEMGADDYIRKPFVVEELISRIRAHLRREKRVKEISDEKILLGDIVIYKDRYEVTKAGEIVPLTTREFQLFLYLVQNVGNVLSKTQIFDAVWGENYGDVSTVTVNIKNIRTKIDPGNRYIKTVWGVGYKIVLTED
ncbi:MAG: response regulator transcription factor [Clostridium sp.]